MFKSWEIIVTDAIKDTQYSRRAAELSGICSTQETDGIIGESFSTEKQRLQDMPDDELKDFTRKILKDPDDSDFEYIDWIKYDMSKIAAVREYAIRMKKVSPDEIDSYIQKEADRLNRVYSKMTEKDIDTINEIAESNLDEIIK